MDHGRLPRCALDDHSFYTPVDWMVRSAFGDEIEIGPDAIAAGPAGKTKVPRCKTRVSYLVDLQYKKIGTSD